MVNENLVIFDFGALLLLLTVITGLIFLFDAFFLAKRRKQKFGSDAKLPWVIDYGKAFFPVFLIVFLLRSFLVEPFRIPSNSMMPTLLTGDFILVNKFTYGLRMPYWNVKFLPTGRPLRGDVVVFRPPHQPETPYIKRVIGLPGDKIVVDKKKVYINGQEIEHKFIEDYQGFWSGAEMTGAEMKREELPIAPHNILIQKGNPGPAAFGLEADVPPGHYFVMGDNRDHSADSRVWGFLPEDHLMGKAFMVFFHADLWHGAKFERMGMSID